MTIDALPVHCTLALPAAAVEALRGWYDTHAESFDGQRHPHITIALCVACRGPRWKSSAHGTPALTILTDDEDWSEQRLCDRCEEFSVRFPDVFRFVLLVRDQSTIVPPWGSIRAGGTGAK